KRAIRAGLSRDGIRVSLRKNARQRAAFPKARCTMRRVDLNSRQKNNGQVLRTVWWMLAFVVIMIVVAIRVRLLAIPLERDEGEYAYAGQLLLQGIPPYKLAYNMKFPGIYAAYALIMALFGQTPVGIHMGLLLINLATVSLVLGIALRLT